MRYYSDVLKKFYDCVDDLISAEAEYEREQEQSIKDKEQYQLLVDELTNVEETYKKRKSDMSKEYDEQCKKYTDAYEELMAEEYKRFNSEITSLNKEYDERYNEIRKKMDEFDKTHLDLAKCVSDRDATRSLLELLFNTL